MIDLTKPVKFLIGEDSEGDFSLPTEYLALSRDIYLDEYKDLTIFHVIASHPHRVRSLALIPEDYSLRVFDTFQLDGDIVIDGNLIVE